MSDTDTGTEHRLGRVLQPRESGEDVFDFTADLAHDAIDYGGCDPFEVRIALEKAAAEIQEREA